MKIGWVRAAERHLSAPERGLVGALLHLVDGTRDWHPVSTAPFNRDVELRIVGENGSTAAPFPCRQTDDGWINADLGVRTKLRPVAWRPWPGDA